jgi:uncharacterized membrane protein
VETLSRGWKKRLRWATGAPGREKGQALVLMVIALPLAMVLVGLVVDGGMMYLAHRAATTAANLAAQAASHAIDEDYSRRPTCCAWTRLGRWAWPGSMPPSTTGETSR